MPLKNLCLLAQKLANNQFNPVLRYIQEIPDNLLNSFACGRKQLDLFLREDAKQYQDLALTTTVVVFSEKHEGIVGYFSLSADAVLLKNSEQFELGLGINFPIRYIPAAKITKLAVASSLQNKKIGQKLIDLICGLANVDNIAIRLLTVDAVNTPEVISFYESVGFVTSLNDSKGCVNRDKETVLMFKDLFAS